MEDTDGEDIERTLTLGLFFGTKRPESDNVLDNFTHTKNATTLLFSCHNFHVVTSTNVQFIELSHSMYLLVFGFYFANLTLG